MKKSVNMWMTVLLFSLAFTGCAGKKTEIETGQQIEIVTEATTETQIMEPEVEPEYQLQNNYYEYMNHTFLEDIEIPGDAARWSYFYDLENEAYQNLDVILQETVENRSQLVDGSTQQQIADFYLTAMDQTGRDQGGFGQLQPYLDAITQSLDVETYLKAIASLSGDLGYSSIYGYYPEADMANSSEYVTYMMGPDLVLGKELLEEEGNTALKDRYKQYIKEVLMRTGEEETMAQQAAEEIFAFQLDLAGASLSLADSGDPSNIYHPLTADQVAELMPNANIKELLPVFQAQGDRYIVMDLGLMDKVNQYLTKEHLPMLKNFSKFILINDTARYLNTDICDAYLEFVQFVNGTQEMETEEKLASKMTQESLAFEFGKLYVEHYFSEEDKQSIENIARDILKTYRTRIDELDWMSGDTKEAAKRKLDTMTLKIGYPDQWPKTLEQTKITGPEAGGLLINNMLEISRDHLRETRDRFDKPVDKNQWMMTPQTVNAYYSPLNNEIVFPAAILQAPYYVRDAAYEENLGGIGMVIAHEITHAFDNSGAQYDEYGNFNIWWTEADYENFQKLSDAVVDYYNGFTVLGDHHVNGEQTLGENIADLGAMACVIEIAGNDPEKLKKLFERYAQIWAFKSNDEDILLRLNTDVHSPSDVRVNAVLSTLEVFYKTYQIEPGDGMYVAPEKRVKVW